MEDKEIKVEEVSLDDVASVTPAPDTETANTSESAFVDDCAAKIDALQAEVNNLRDKYLRTAAELENTRRRAAVDAQNASRARAMSMAGKILPVMDAVDAALKHNPDDAGLVALGRALESAFDQIGIVKIKSVGEKLNPQLHNAIQVVEIPADMNPRPESNTIMDEMQSGYMFDDNILRTAMVVVYK